MWDNILDFLVVAIPFIVTVVGVVTSFKQPKTESHKRWLVCLVIVGILGSVITWWQQSRAREAQKKRDNAIADLEGQMTVVRDMLLHPQSNSDTQYISATVREIAKQMKVTAPVISHPPTSGTIASLPSGLRGLTDQEIRNKTIELVRQMREYEKNFETAQFSAIASRHYDPNEKPEDKTARFQREATDDFQAHIQEGTDYSNRFHTDALSLEQDLLRRLNLPTPPPAQRPLALRTGELYGVRPIGEVADYLEMLAKKLSPTL